MNEKIKNSCKYLTVQLAMVLLLSLLMGMSASAKTFTFKETELITKKGKILDGGKTLTVRLNSAGIFNASNARSSNKKVLTVKLAAKGAGMTVRLKKPGKATVSMKGIYGRYSTTKTVDIKYIYTVIRYVNPFKSLKIGDKQMASLFNNSTSETAALTGLSGPLEIRLRKGWKLKSVNYIPDGTNEDDEWGQDVSNHSPVSFTGAGGEISIILRNTKLKRSMYFSISDSAM